MPRAPLSILHVDLSKHFGGTERYCLDLAERQITAGHKVGLVAWRARKGRNVIQRHAPPGLSIYEAPPIFSSWTVNRAIREQKADIVNVHLPDSARAVTAAKKRPPVVMTMHLRYRAKEARGIDGLVFVAHWQEQEAASFRGLTTTAHNWPPAELAPDPVRIKAARAAIGGDKNTFVIGFLARLNRIKRPDLLIDAFKRAKLENARLAIVGDGPEGTALKARAGGNPNIVFLGQQADVENWHRAFDLFVLPSDWEGLPLSVLEAMRAGTPILATASAGTAEVLAGSGATLVPCGDVMAMEEALIKLYFQRLTADVVPRLTYDLSSFDADFSVAQIEDFYRAVIAAKTAP